MPSAEHESPIALTRLDPDLVGRLLATVFGVKVPADYHTPPDLRFYEDITRSNGSSTVAQFKILNRACPSPDLALKTDIHRSGYAPGPDASTVDDVPGGHA
jgi:hypothetical protein